MLNSNFLRKAEVLKNGDYENYRFVRQKLNSEFRNIPVSENNPFDTLEEALQYDAWKRENDSELWKECERLDHARCSRVIRLRSKIAYMLAHFECCFVTLTFTDNVLSKTSPHTRHVYVKRWLGDFPCGIANIDFGGKNNREHYHAIVPVAKIKHDSWGYGAVKGETIHNDSDSIDKVARYTAKLVNHAIKETTKGCRSIYHGYFGQKYKPKDNLPSHKTDAELKSDSELRKSLYFADRDYDEMVKQGVFKRYFVEKGKFPVDSRKIDSDGFLCVTDEDIARIDSLFCTT